VLSTHNASKCSEFDNLSPLHQPCSPFSKTAGAETYVTQMAQVNMHMKKGDQRAEDVQRRSQSLVEFSKEESQPLKIKARASVPLGIERTKRLCALLNKF